MVKSKIALSVVLASVLYSGLAASEFDAIGGSGDSTNYVGDGEVTITQGATETATNVYGKKEDSANEVTGGKVTMTGGQISGVLVGGYSEGPLATVKGNKVYINIESDENAAVNSNIYGGQSAQGHATGNRVEITGKAPDPADTKLPSNDKLNFKGHGFIAGGAAGDHTKLSLLTIPTALDSIGNHVTLKYVGTYNPNGGKLNDTYDGVTVGGGFGSGEISDNHVKIYDSYISAYVYSGWYYGVSVVGGITSEGAEHGKVYNNEVRIENSTIGRGVAGGTAVTPGSGKGNGKVVVSGNKVTIINSKITTGDHANSGSVYGGFSMSSGLSTNNEVHLKDTDVVGDVFGSRFQKLDVSSENIVEINGGTVNGNGADKGVAGARGPGGVTDSTVTIKGKATVSGSNGVVGGFSGNTGHVERNEVIIEDEGTTINAIIKGGHASNGNANDNNITIRNGAIAGNSIIGGQSAKGGNTNNNIINIDKNADISKVTEITGGKSTDGEANENKVHIGGNTNAKVTGGDGKTSASDNKIIIDGKTGGTVIGGKSTGDTNKNTITLGGDIETGAKIYGGSDGTNAKGNDNIVNLVKDLVNVKGDIHVGKKTSEGGTGNTLNINTKNPITINSTVDGAQNININVGNMGNGDTAVTVGSGGSVDVEDAKITANIKVKPDFNAGDEITLFKEQDGGQVTGTPNSVDAKAVKGGAIYYKLDIDKDSITEPGKAAVIDQGGGGGSDDGGSGGGGYTPINPDNGGDDNGGDDNGGDDNGGDDNGGDDNGGDNKPIVVDMGVMPITKTLSEGMAASAAALSLAADNIAGKGVESATSSTANSNASAGSTVIAPFGSIIGGTNKIKTGSYVKSNGINLMTGAAIGKYTDNGKLTIGPFVEFGKSWYSTYNDFGQGEVKGDGDSKYIGAGVLARYDFGNTSSSRPYIEGSARFGRNYNTYENTHMTDGFGNYAQYDMNTNYFGIHIGAGYEFRKDNKSFDIYAKYLYTRLNGANLNIMGVPYEFKAVNSHRLVTGARYKVDLEAKKDIKISPYAGAALDYEFKGDANAYASGFAVDSPSLKGASAMMEAGVTIANDKGLSADVGVFGHLGKRKGINGMLSIKFEF